MLSLGLGLLLASCQTDNVPEDMPAENQTAVSEAATKDVTNKIHTPDWMIHTPDWMKAAFEDCDNFPAYTGSASLNVTSKDSFDFGKEVMLENLGVGGEMNVCGRLGVAKNTVIRKGGELTVSGMMTTGNEESPQDLRITYGGHLNVRGFLVVTGDLILGNGASLHFITDFENSEITNKLIVLGDIIEADYSHLTGEYELSHDLDDLEEEH